MSAEGNTKTVWAAGGLIGGAVLALAVSALISRGTKPLKPFVNRHDTPIVIAGGSFHGIIRSANANDQWVQTTGNNYSTTVANGSNTLVTFRRFFDVNNNPAPSPLQGTINGWRITFSNKDGNFGDNPKAARLCSFDKCDDPNTPITLDGHNKVFFANLGHTSLKGHDAMQALWVHDTNCSGDIGSDEEKDCDFISAIKVESKVTEGNPVTYYCPFIHCKVMVGLEY